MPKPNISHAELLRVLRYLPSTGEFFWRVSPRSRTKVGDPAGTTEPKGYKAVVIFGKRYYLHRLAWFYVHGSWPESEIDHKNKKRGDNRISNLRPATSAQNKQNIERRVDSTTGVQGVRLLAGAFEPRITVQGKEVYLGRYNTLAEAVAVRAGAKKKLHPFSNPR